MVFVVGERVNGTGAVRQFVSKATRLKLPSGLLADWLRCSHPLSLAAGATDDGNQQVRMSDLAFLALT
jgi:hypothetical protein